MKISKNGIAFIKQWEGCKLTAYKAVPTEKYYTIGIGHYGADVECGMAITQTQAEQMLAKDVASIETLLNDLHIPFSQPQFDSLVSLIFNIGAANFNSSTMKKKIVARSHPLAVTDEMVRWVRSGGVILLGLQRRRVAEANMYLGRNAYYMDRKAIKRKYHYG